MSKSRSSNLSGENYPLTNDLIPEASKTGEL
jgi:hypothetical protein